MPRLLTATVLIAVLALSGCRTAAVYNASDVAYAGSLSGARVLSEREYRDAIVRAGARRGWTFDEQGPGHLQGKVSVRGKHSATVDLYYDRDKFSILYNNSQNLRYDASAKTIHPNYNSWVALLEQDIQSEIATLKAGG